jgi:hypothetical protein
MQPPQVVRQISHFQWVQKIRTREDEEGARYWLTYRKVFGGKFFVCLSLKEIGNTGVSLLFMRVLLMVFLIFNILEHI